MTDFVGGLFGQGGTSGVSIPGGVFGAGVYGSQVFTPAYDLQTGLGPNQALQTTLRRGSFNPVTGLNDLSPFQLEMERRFPQFLAEGDRLRAMAAPTASLFRTAAMGQIASAENQALGNLREQLARRGLSGASFAQDTEARIQGEFGQQRAQTELAAAQQEIGLTTELINFQNSFIQQSLAREFAELGLAAGQNVNFGQIAQQNSAVNAQLMSLNAQIASQEYQARLQQQGQLIGLGTFGALGGFGGVGGGATALTSSQEAAAIASGWDPSLRFGSGSSFAPASFNSWRWGRF